MKFLTDIARILWRFVLRVIEVASAVLTIVGVYFLLHQADWAELAHFFHLR